MLNTNKNIDKQKTSNHSHKKSEMIGEYKFAYNEVYPKNDNIHSV